MHVVCLFFAVLFTRVPCLLSSGILFDGSQFISRSLLAKPLDVKGYKMTITFHTTLSSCVLFFASGVTGDYIALELIRGRLRYVSNSNGLKSSSPIDVIHGNYANYADGNYHQVNVEIEGEMTKLYSYSTGDDGDGGDSNITEIRSTSSDLKYDLDEYIYYAGLPINKKTNTKNILLSHRNFEGCLYDLQLDDKAINLTKEHFVKTPSDSFVGEFNSACSLTQPDYLISFKTGTDELSVFSHVNDDHFLIEFYYRTYLQNGVLLHSISSKKSSSILLILRDNELKLYINITKQKSIVFNQYDKNADDGTWRKIRIEISATAIEFRIDDQKFAHKFNRTVQVAFPNQVIFSGRHERTHGLIGCIKNIRLGKDLVSVKTILGQTKRNYTEGMCTMKDLCFPNRPCKNGGRCIQNLNGFACDCKGTGFKGETCEIDDVQHYRKTCSDYNDAGFHQDGIYTIKPGKSAPYKVRCHMTHPDGPMTILDVNNVNQTFVFQGNNYNDDFYYHQVTYKANKRQVLDLVTASGHCSQYFRYNCYESTLLNSNEESHQSTKYGVRWYSRSGLLRNYWSGSQDNRRTCKCGINKTCASPKVLCNCDIMDKRWRYDDGYIDDKKDLPISKIRVSRHKTSTPSSFQIGMLKCTGTDSNHIPTVSTSNKNSAPSGNGVYHKGHNNETTLTTNEQTKPSSFILIDSKLLYIIIVAVAVLIVLFMLILIFKRRICCCYYEFNAKPQIVELYKEEISRNNNKNVLQVSNDVTVNVDDLVIPLSKGMSSYPTSCSDSSVSTIDPGRYYAEDGDPDTFSLQSNKSTLSMPKRGILKIKKDSIVTQSKTAKNVEPLPITTCCRSKRDLVSVLSKGCDNEFNYELDNSDNCLTMSPLKQKVLELSTNTNRQNFESELYFRQESNSSNSSSLVSSKESEINSDTDNDVFTTSPECIPLNKYHRSKSVRFSDEETQLLSNRTPHRSRKRTFEAEDLEGLIYCEESNKTLV